MKIAQLTRRELFRISALLSSVLLFKKALSRPAPGEAEKKFAASGRTLSYRNDKRTITFAPEKSDGPPSALFQPLLLQGNVSLQGLDETRVSSRMARAASRAPAGSCTAWGIPFVTEKNIVFIKENPVTLQLAPFRAAWLVFLHTADIQELQLNADGLYDPPFKGEGLLGEHMADYVILYSDGTQARQAVKRRQHIGMFQRRWGENCYECTAHHKPYPVRSHHEQTIGGWGWSQTRVSAGDGGEWVNWVWAWGNPHPEKDIAGLQFEPQSGAIVLSAVSAGDINAHPLAWRPRRKAMLTLPSGVEFNPVLNDDGVLQQIQLDLGQVISAVPRLSYPNENWSRTDNNALPEVSKQDILLEYTAHAQACFHLSDGTRIAVADVEKENASGPLRTVPASEQYVRIKVTDKHSKKPVAVKLHVHGEYGEYLAPVDRHRQPIDAWFEDYSVDFVHNGLHTCSYISGETLIRLPLGRIYVEVSKGFEIRPVRKVFDITPDTAEIAIELERVLDWGERGWVTADTHVHFLSPGSALLEGAGEDVNVVNLLASQWGELMTNVGDFDGKTTFGSREAGGDGQYLVRVGTENRQHILGHISLLGYNGNIIAPMTTGGADESAIGDPIEFLLTEWARQCKSQGGIVILPHFPNPRMEHAAAVVSGDIDAVEMTSWGNLYGGISPYSLCDWYRYLNCGYFIAAVGGTDKMSSGTAVGTVRTYAQIDGDEFTYDSWKAAVRKGRTFVSYGPLLECAVEGKSMGSRIKMPASGGTVTVTWKTASVTIPMSKAELIVNGEVRESAAVRPDQAEGYWTLKIDKSAWVAVLVRGKYSDKAEIIAAHSSPVMIEVEGSQFYSATDAVTILEQIEGTMVYMDTIGTRAQDRVYKRMRLVLESAHRSLHNRMHQSGMYHQHTPQQDHREHRNG